MRPSFFYPGLSVAVDDDPKRMLWLVCRSDAFAIQIDGGWERMPPHEAEMALFTARLDSTDVERFLGRARAHGSLFEGYDGYYSSVAELEHLVASGDLVALRESAAPDHERERVREEREVARAIMNGQRTLTLVPGRRSLLVSGADFQAMSGRDRYRVLGRTEAATLLSAAGKAQAAGHASVWERGIALLAPDWRIPQTPQGLVLLVEIPTAVAGGVSVPAITPSQVRTLVEKAALRIHVVDLDGVAQKGLAYAIDMPDGGSVSGSLDDEGRGEAKSSVPGTFTVRFPDLDGADWDGDGALELPEEERSEASKHEVKQGERLPTIARASGFARWQTIWDFSGNADLRELRGNPYILRESDDVVIPSKLRRAAEVPGGIAEYVVQRAAETLRVRFAEAEATDGEPVMFRAVPDAGDEMFEGELAADGTMEIDLPPDTTRVTVELYCGEGDDPFVTYEFDVGHMDPYSEATGIQMRLANLGYYDGEIDGDVGIVTRSAIRRFRSEYGLPLEDDIDDDLRKALAWVHDDDDDTDECEADQTTAAEVDVSADDGSDEHDEGERDGSGEEDADIAATPDIEEEPVVEPDDESVIAELEEDQPEEWPPEEWGREPLEQADGGADRAGQSGEDGNEVSGERAT